MRKLFAFGVCLAIAFGVYLGMSGVERTAPLAEAKGTVYEGTIYVAGMGGHFAAAKVSIDPSNTDAPITVVNLDRVVIGTKDTHPTHDPRVDNNDPTKLYWSTYKPDKVLDPSGRTAHVGVSNLKTGEVIKDVPVKLDDKATWTGALYCASGQSKDYFMPVTMTDLPYIDVFSKGDLALKQRVFLDYKPGETFFFHGSNDASMTKFVLAVNRKDDKGTPNGKVDMYILDIPSLEKGKVKILAKGNLAGTPGKTITFRQDFTPDGNYILQSGGDRFFLLDNDLKLIDEEMMNLGENHDAITTPDGKYAVLTLRVSVGDAKDGQLVLYDINNKQVVGKAASVCMGCHDGIGIKGNATLCGEDAVWN